MKRCIRTVMSSALVLFLVLAGCADSHADKSGLPTSTADLVAMPQEGWRSWSGQITTGPGLGFPLTIEVTSKGNGSLKLDGWQIRVCDEHDDGFVYDPPLLHLRNVDDNDDGYNDLVIFGDRVCTEDCLPGSERSAVLVVLLFDPKTRHFQLATNIGGEVIASPVRGSLKSSGPAFPRCPMPGARCCSGLTAPPSHARFRWWFWGWTLTAPAARAR